MKILLFSILPFLCFAQSNYEISTVDINNFWNAFDQLKNAKSKKDSVKIIQEEYIEKGTNYFKKFIEARNFTAEEYIEEIVAAPKFWNSIRPLTLNIVNRKKEIDQALQSLKKEIPGFKIPNVCFAIGCLRTGGTTSKNLILIGSEISVADHTVDKSELGPWLNAVMGNTGDIVSMVAHEAIHTRQKFGVDRTLLTASISEGVCDFITKEILNLNINTHIHDYGNQHECQLWKEFKSEMNSPRIYGWLYNGNKSIDRPADLGYFIGYKISEAYFNQKKNKKKALRKLLNRKKYRQIFEESQYQGKCTK